MLGWTSQAARLKLSDVTRYPMRMLSLGTYLVRYTYGANFRCFENILDVGTGYQLLLSVDVGLCDTFYYLRCQDKPEI